MLVEDGMIKNIYGDKEKEKELNSNYKSYRYNLDVYLIALVAIGLFIGMLVL